jgi:galactokinase
LSRTNPKPRIRETYYSFSGKLGPVKDALSRLPTYLYDGSRPELDWVVERAIALRGVQGARLTGAGWGGCAIVVGDEDALREAGPLLATEYESRFALAPRLWLSTAAPGARLEATG